MKSDAAQLSKSFQDLSSSRETEPLDFARRFLELHGAAVQNEQGGLEALVPEELGVRLGIPEHTRIYQDNPEAAEETETHLINYGAPLLEKMLAETLQRAPLASCSLEFDYIKSGGFERLLRDQLTFYGAIASIETVGDIRTRYLHMDIRYTAQCDEQKEGLLSLVHNLETRTFVPDMAGMLDNLGFRLKYGRPPDGSRDLAASLQPHVDRCARIVLKEQLEPFRRSMERRLKRDVDNLREYYRSLEQEMRANLDNPNLSDSARQDRLAKIETLPQELNRKIEDLQKKYTIRVRTRPVAAILLNSPAKKLVCRVIRGRMSGQLSLTYNPVTRGIDPLACNKCGSSITHLHFNAELAPLCLECAGL